MVTTVIIPVFQVRKLRTEKWRSLPRVTQLVSDESGFESRQCGSIHCFARQQPCHFFPHCPPPAPSPNPKASSFNVLLVVTLGLIGE